MSSSTRRKLKRAVAARDGAACVWCAVALEPDSGATSLDHALPQKLDGSWWEGNLLLSCQPCNCTRGHRPLLEWAAECEQLGYTIDRAAVSAAWQRCLSPLATVSGFEAHYEAQKVVQIAQARARKVEREAAQAARLESYRRRAAERAARQGF